MSDWLNWPAPGEWRRLLLEALVLLAVGVVLGFSVHHRLLLAVFDGRHLPPRAAPEGTLLPQPVMLDELPGLIEAGALLIDARIPELYREGHLPGALNLPFDEADLHLAGFQLSTRRDRALILYCSGFGCPDSFDLGVRLLAQGFTDVRVFEGGYPEWRDAGWPTEEGGP